jgi:hypothetical protein
VSKVQPVFHQDTEHKKQPGPKAWFRLTARTDVERTMTATAYAVEHAVANIFALPSPTLCLQQPEQIAAIVPSALPLALQQRVNQMRNAIGSGDTATASQIVDQIVADTTWQQTGPHRAFVYFAVGDALQLAGHRNLDAQRGMIPTEGYFGVAAKVEKSVDAPSPNAIGGTAVMRVPKMRRGRSRPGVESMVGSW